MGTRLVFTVLALAALGLTGCAAGAADDDDVPAPADLGVATESEVQTPLAGADQQLDAVRQDQIVGPVDDRGHELMLDPPIYRHSYQLTDVAYETVDHVDDPPHLP